MKYLLILTLLPLIPGKFFNPVISDAKNEIYSPAFQQLLDSANVKGSVLLYDPEEKKYYSNNFEYSRKGFLPASTFKITNSIIALETGVVENESSVLKWDGKKRNRPEWEKDLTLKEAYSVSCVPCYQEIARKIGVVRMNDWLAKLNYGKMIVDSSSIDRFWLEGNSEISQFEQIGFLERLHNAKLPVTKRTLDSMKLIMLMDENEQYRLYGKTGWAIRNGNNYGWFVGYIEKNGKVYYFATNVQPEDAFNMEMFPKIRTDITLKCILQVI